MLKHYVRSNELYFLTHAYCTSRLLFTEEGQEDESESESTSESESEREQGEWERTMYC